MALALLDLLGLDAQRARLRVDTGTNRYYQVKLGLAAGSRGGFDWIDEVVHETPIALNPAGGGLLNTATEVTVPIRGLVRPARGLPAPRLFAQLFSFKTAQGRSLGFSGVLTLDRAMTSLVPNFQGPLSVGEPVLCPPRAVPCRTCSEQFSAPRLDDLLAQIVRVAAPLVLQLLGQQGPSAANASAAPIGPLLQAVAGVVPGLVSQPSTTTPVSHSQSTLLTPDAGATENRFATGRPALSQPMVFGIDDAILGSLVAQVAGPLLQVLPQLLNASNQQRVQLQQDRNHLVSDLVGQVQRRMLLQQVLQAQQQAPPAQAPDLQRLADLLRAADAAPADGAPSPAVTPAAVTPAPSAAATSLSSPPVVARAVASFVLAPALPFPGGDQVLFARGRDVTLQVKLAVGDPVPAAPLPKAIVRVVIKDPVNQHVLAEKVVKQHGLPANSTVAVPFTAAQLTGVPAGRPVSLLAEIRWRVSAGQERRALGAQDAVFVDRLFVKARGGDAGSPRELTDMGRYRAFWNKVWESPTLSDGKRLWGLDATMKYTVLLATEPSNGVMQTRLSTAPDAASDQLRLQTAGRMKAGIECSVEELAKLTTLWDGEPVLDADHVAAFRSEAFAHRNAGDAIVSVKLSGPREERGLVWVVPVLGLVDHTLGSVTSTNDNGQVTAAAEEHAHLPLPVAIRILELRSGQGSEASTSGDEPEYHFDGYRIERSEKVVLTPHG